MNLLTQYKGLPKQIYVLCFARVIVAMGAFVFSLSTLIMTGLLGMSEIAVGYMMIFLSLTSLVGAVLCGRLADIFSRKKVFLGLIIFQMSAQFIGGFIVYNKLILICLLVNSFCFSGFQPILAAMIADSTTESNRKESFSLLFLCVNIGYSLGQVIAGQLFYDHTRWIFWGVSILFAIVAFIMYFFVNDVRVQVQNVPSRLDSTPEEQAHGDFKDFLKCVFKDKILIIFLISSVCMHYCYAEISYLMPLHLTDIVGLEHSAEWVSYLWLVNGIFCVIWTPLLLPISKKFNQIFNVRIAALVYFIGFGAYSLVRGENMLWIVLAATPIWTAGEVILGTGTGVFIADRAKPEHRASYQSLYSFAVDIGRCLGPWSMGYMLQVIYYADGWYTNMICSGIAMIVLTYGIKCYKKENMLH